jgi:hypothetical protein
MSGRTPLQTVAALVGAVFLLVGILGFIPGLVTDYDSLTFAAHDGAELLGIFEVNVLHNLVHVAFGVAGLALAKSVGGAKRFLIGGGAVYLVLFVYGLVVDHGSSANFAAINSADNVLHVGLGAAMVLLGVALSRPGRLQAAAA